MLAFDEHAAGYAGERVYTLGKLDALHEAAQRLYGVLRRCGRTASPTFCRNPVRRKDWETPS